MDQIMAKPRKAENHMINGTRILKVGESNFKAPGAMTALGYAKKYQPSHLLVISPSVSHLSMM
jgi:hypothetical protein